ncbi:MAG: bifunctional phosphoribosyl-AMP cyclohydrolase/phosphoribosyl-ATP diphosphatase HisIE [Bacteroidetes bacterium]|nr:bifunctional phosphoribosyl-AMP cyclohydrolase/phosphoribosyl-ATP diphosphatase HisIE [Bacteroidota bacterium]
MKIDFSKSNGLVPAIIQDANTAVVLMLGYMNEEAFAKTKESGKVTFFSRTKNRIWTKGEESGNFLNVVDIKIDCDNDTLLIKANPVGPTCHTGADTCWNEKNISNDFIKHLESTIQNRRDNPSEESYTSKLLKRGINKVAQKVGEEAVELVIEAKDNDKGLFLNEAADLMYHYLVLLAAKKYTLDEVITILKERHK